MDSLLPQLLLLAQLPFVLAQAVLGITEVVVSSLLQRQFLGDERRVQMGQSLLVVLALEGGRPGVEVEPRVIGPRLERALVFLQRPVVAAALVLFQRLVRRRPGHRRPQKQSDQRSGLRDFRSAQGRGGLVRGSDLFAFRQKHFDQQ